MDIEEFSDIVVSCERVFLFEGSLYIRSCRMTVGEYLL
jgi:hypothetical protein